MGRLLSRIPFRWTIKGRIAFAFLAMGAVSIALGVLTVAGADRASRLVTRTYDEALVSNSYARAAAGDFANMQASFARAQLAPATRRDAIAMQTAALHDSFLADLATAVEKAGSPAVGAIADKLRASEAEWLAATRRLGPNPTSAELSDLDRRSRLVEAQVEAMVTTVSDQAFAFRNQAQGLVDHDVRFATIGVAVALCISGFVALMLYWRISAPVGSAARFAREIAAGVLDGDPPKHASDEIGELIGAMVTMRGDIGSMMDEQVVLRELSQARVAEALEGSADGVVIVDARGMIQIANSRALDCLGITHQDVWNGRPVGDILARLDRAGGARSPLLRLQGTAETEEILLPDGRWIRNSRSRTTEGGLVALYTDITAMKDQQARLGEANLTLDAALGNMSQGLCLFDADNRLKLANSRFRALFRLGEADIAPGTSYATIVGRVLAQTGGKTADVDRLVRYERAVLRRRQTLTRTVTLGPRTIAIAQQQMPEGGWIGTYEDVTERKRAESQIAFLANHDALTRLPNRIMFARRVEDAIARARRGSSFAIHCLDLDHFKQVNDTLGHAVGDQLLLAVTDRLLGCVRDVDTVARLGGDEFAILQTDLASPEQGSALAQRLVDTLTAPYVIESHDITIGASVGIALSPNDGLNHGLLLKSADAALYKAKEDGRRTWRFFEASMDENLQARHALEADLRRAIGNDEFEVFFQPLLDVRSGQIRSFEALVRWRHPVRGLVPPDKFIPVAEETGLIIEIGRWVLGAACAEAMRWPAHICVAVNVSTIQLRDPGFAETVTDALAGSGLPPARLELEITESVFMANTTKIMPILKTLRGAGVRFAMDDFGTGYSSLSTLRAFPFDKIKIDRSFIRDMSAADAAAQIIRTILALGRSLGMRVTAEGVETRAQHQFLEAEGCDEIQGYLLSRPMPQRDVITWLGLDGTPKVDLAA